MRLFAAFFLGIIQAVGEKTRAIVVCLYGDLGAGKTTFVKSVVAHTGVSDVVTSPTFVIMKQYRIPVAAYRFKKIIHIDAYRLTERNDMDVLGWREIERDPDSLIFIEWPTRVKDFLPEDALKIHFEFVDEKTREIIIDQELPYQKKKNLTNEKIQQEKNNCNS